MLVYQPMKSSESAKRPSPDKKSLKHLRTFRGHSSLRHKNHSGSEKLPRMTLRCTPMWATLTEHSVTVNAELLVELVEVAEFSSMAGSHDARQSVQFSAGVRQYIRAIDLRLLSARPSSVALQTNWGMMTKAISNAAKRKLTMNSQRRKL